MAVSQAAGAPALQQCERAESPDTLEAATQFQMPVFRHVNDTQVQTSPADSPRTERPLRTEPRLVSQLVKVQPRRQTPPLAAETQTEERPAKEIRPRTEARVQLSDIVLRPLSSESSQGESPIRQGERPRLKGRTVVCKQQRERACLQTRFVPERAISKKQFQQASERCRAILQSQKAERRGNAVERYREPPEGRSESIVDSDDCRCGAPTPDD